MKVYSKSLPKPHSNPLSIHSVQWMKHDTVFCEQYFLFLTSNSSVINRNFKPFYLQILPEISVLVVSMRRGEARRGEVRTGQDRTGDHICYEDFLIILKIIHTSLSLHNYCMSNWCTTSEDHWLHIVPDTSFLKQRLLLISLPCFACC